MLGAARTIVAVPFLPTRLNAATSVRETQSVTPAPPPSSLSHGDDVSGREVSTVDREVALRIIDHLPRTHNWLLPLDSQSFDRIWTGVA